MADTATPIVAAVTEEYRKRCEAKTKTGFISDMMGSYIDLELGKCAVHFVRERSGHFFINWHTKILNNICMQNGSNLKGDIGNFTIYSENKQDIPEYLKDRISIDDRGYLVLFQIEDRYLEKIIEYSLMGKGPSGVWIGIDMWQSDDMQTLMDETVIKDARAQRWSIHGVDFLW